MTELYVSIYGANPLKYIREEIQMINIQKLIQQFVTKQNETESKFRESRIKLIILKKQIKNKKRGNILLGRYNNEEKRKKMIKMNTMLDKGINKLTPAKVMSPGKTIQTELNL